MPLFKQSAAERFTPKEIKFSKLYQTNVKSRRAVGDSVLWQTKQALKKAGYDDKTISEVITQDKPASVSQMKEIATILNKSKIYGFEKDPVYAIKNYLNKERVKAQSIARIRREHILEMSEQELGGASVTTLNQKATGPTAGEMPEMLRRQQERTTSFLGSSKKVSSLSGKAGGGGFLSGKTGSSLKPKY